MSAKPINLVSYACGIGAGNQDCEKGPVFLQDSPFLKGLNIHWQEILKPHDRHGGLEALPTIHEICERLAFITHKLAQEKEFFITLGGDHSSAIGTWSGVASAIFPEQLGLMWIDAHLDSHTLETTPSDNIHGMPLAALLGYGDPLLTGIMSKQPKLLPQNVCVLGARSYESEEQALLERLNVRIFYMDEIHKRGFEEVFKEGIDLITRHTHRFGISIDLDAIDPHEAPGVGSPVAKGIIFDSFVKGLKGIRSDPRFIATEIAEFNPNLDRDQKTEKIIGHLLEIFSTN